VLLPYGTYAPYMYVTPVYYQPIPQTFQQRSYSNQINPTRMFSFILISNLILFVEFTQRSTTIVDNTHYYNTGVNNYANASVQRAEEDTQSETESETGLRLDQMDAMSIYKMIKDYSQHMPRARVSWLNKLLLKVTNQAEFYKSLEIIDLYQTRLSEITPETGTLFIKAACRAGEPEIALSVLKVRFLSQM
jgi:hypothetical protein